MKIIVQDSHIETSMFIKNERKMLNVIVETGDVDGEIILRVADRMTAVNVNDLYDAVRLLKERNDTEVVD